MIQINLIPDVKQDYLRAQRTRNIAISLSIIAGLASVGLLAVLGLIVAGQIGLDLKAKSDIKTEFNKLQSVEDLPNLLTIQNQLSVLPDQHEKASRDSRLFNVISAINPAEPNNVSFSSVKLDPENSTVTLEGSAPGGYPAVESLKKTIESTKFEYAADKDGGNTGVESVNMASNTSVTSTNFGEDASGARVLRFTISFSYAEGLFTNERREARIVSPTQRIDVTDSRVRVPESLFRAVKPSEEKQ